jgi:hypothetical protein
MNRRSAVNRVGLLMGATFLSTEIFISGCKSENSNVVENRTSKKSPLDDYKDLLANIGAVIIPAHGNHPGFKAINGIESALSILSNCYKPDVVEKMVDGIVAFEALNKKKYNKSFSDLSDKDKLDVVTELDKLFFDKNTKVEDKSTFYGQAKEAILLSYFTNKQIMTGPLTYTKVPGKYEEVKIDGTKNIALYGIGS